MNTCYWWNKQPVPSAEDKILRKETQANETTDPPLDTAVLGQMIVVGFSLVVHGTQPMRSHILVDSIGVMESTTQNTCLKGAHDG